MTLSQITIVFFMYALPIPFMFYGVLSYQVGNTGFRMEDGDWSKGHIWLGWSYVKPRATIEMLLYSTFWSVFPIVNVSFVCAIALTALFTTIFCNNYAQRILQAKPFGKK